MLEPILTPWKELAFLMATVIPGLDSTVSDLGLSNNIYVLSDKQDATAYQQPSLNQPAANKILKSEGKKVSLSSKDLLETGLLSFSDAFT